MEFSAGQSIQILSLAKRGKFIRLINQSQALVLIGKMEVRIALQDLQAIESEPVKKSTNAKRPTPPLTGAKKKPLILDYHGFTREACLKDFHEKLNQAYLQGLKEIIVIHGRGQGVLKKALQDYLQQADLRLAFRSSAIDPNQLIITL